MPILTEIRTIETKVVVGMRCDGCGREFDDHDMGFHDFRLSHTFGYDSAADGTHVEACVCDDCLLAIVLERLPGARLTSQYGEPDGADRADMAKRLARKRAGQPMYTEEELEAWRQQSAQEEDHDDE